MLIQLIEAKDPSFASKYNSGNFALPGGNIIATDSGNISLSAWTGDKYDGNPNGFKLGSAQSTSRSTRTMSYCLAFNQSRKAFDNNNSALTASFDHCIAFDSGYNYYISPFKITGWTNVIGFGGKSADKLPSGYSVAKPSNEGNIRNTVESTKNAIIFALRNRLHRLSILSVPSKFILSPSLSPKKTLLSDALFSNNRKTTSCSLYHRIGSTEISFPKKNKRSAGSRDKTADALSETKILNR